MKDFDAKPKLKASEQPELNPYAFTLYEDQRFESPLAPRCEIPVGAPYAMKYPPDWWNQSKAGRMVSVIYWRANPKEPWVLYKTDNTPVLPDEFEKCLFYGQLPYLFDGGRIVMRGVVRRDWQEKWNRVLTDSRKSAPIAPPEGAASEFVQLARTAQLKQAERDKALAQRANEFEDAEMPEPPAFEDEQ